ncbi:hypothetical protein [Microbulbifer variabilis]|uniref:hypothetical protein n=1 Tax=Microbulbifer variabilis TaxID=266805 RepID=UPI001CFD9064|nr:hypothetical protein [Microbulbifer variabilis]
MRKNLAIQFTLQGIFFLGLFAVLVKHGGSDTFTVLHNEARNVFYPHLVGLLLSATIASVLFSSFGLARVGKSAILGLQSIFALAVLAQGSIALIIVPFPVYYAFKYWRAENA